MRKIKCTRKGAGFTIIELLVVITIIVITSGFVVVNFKKASESGKLQRTTQQIIQNIRKAQDMALSSVEVRDTIYNYYGVYFNKNTMPDSFYVFASNNTVYNSGEEVGSAIELEDGIIIYALSTGNNLHVIFEPPYSFVKFNPSVINATITIKKEDGTCPDDCRYIKINDKGWMSIKTAP